MLGICLLSMQLDFMLALLKKDTTTLCLTCKCQEVIACFCIQGCALRKILGSPLGTQPCRLGCPEVKLSHPNEKKKNQKLINLVTLLINI